MGVNPEPVSYTHLDVYKRQKLYSLKVYNASETAIPDMILCKPLQQYILSLIHI